MDANGNTSAPLGVLEEIAQRLAALAPEQCIAPAVAPKSYAHIVCAATDHIRRLYTLRNLLVDECEAIIENGKKMAKKAIETVFAKNPADILKELRTDGSPMRIMSDGSKKLQLELRQKDSLATIVDKILWLEIRRQHPDLQTKPAIGVYSDWSLGWHE